MVSASFDDSDTTLVDFLNNVPPGLFIPSYFSIDVLDAVAVTVTSDGSKSIQIDWDRDVSSGTLITLQSPLPGFLNPQIIAVA